MADALPQRAVETVLRRGEPRGRFGDLTGEQEDTVLAEDDFFGVVSGEVQLQLAGLLPGRVPVDAVEGFGEGVFASLCLLDPASFPPCWSLSPAAWAAAVPPIAEAARTMDAV